MAAASERSKSLRFRWPLALAAAVLVGATAYFFVAAMRDDVDTVKLCMGEEFMRREEFVQIIKSEAAKCRINLILKAGTRGEETLHRLAEGEFDAAIVFGGLGVEEPNVRQVACLRGEPLHLFVKPELAAGGLPALKGKRISVGPRYSETQIASYRIFKHMGMKPGADFTEANYHIDALLALAAAEMPDAVFLSAGLPSPTGNALVQRFGYRLIELPFGEVLALQNPAVFDVKIPANTYSFAPPVPEAPLHTVGCHTMVVANSNASPRAIYRLMELLCESDLPRRLGKKPVDSETMSRVRDFPLHAGVVKYLTRNDPWMSQKLLGEFGKVKELLISGFSALLLGLGWLRRSARPDFGTLLRKATEIELNACRAAEAETLTPQESTAALAALRRLKIDALEQHRQGALPGDGALVEFLKRLENAQQSVAALPVIRGRETRKAA